MTVILHSYTSSRIPDQEETMLAVEALKAIYGPMVISRKVQNPDGYYNFLLDHWRHQTIINIEQDIVPTRYIIESLLDCPYEACTVPYNYPWQSLDTWSLWRGEEYNYDSDGKPIVFYDASGAIDLRGLAFGQIVRYQKPFPKYVEGSGLGMVKIGIDLQKDLPFEQYPFAQQHWSFTDVWISMYMQQKLNTRWHVHDIPIVHNHY